MDGIYVVFESTVGVWQLSFGQNILVLFVFESSGWCILIERTCVVFESIVGVVWLVVFVVAIVRAKHFGVVCF